MNILQSFRRRAGLTQYELAGILGVSRSLIYQVERGQRELPSLASIHLTKLELGLHRKKLLTGLQHQKPDYDSSDIQEAVQVAKSKKLNCEIAITQRSRKLQKMKDIYVKNKAKLATSGFVSAASNITEREKVWTDLTKSNATTKIASANGKNQLKLELEIAVLQASLKTYEDFISKWKGSDAK